MSIPNYVELRLHVEEMYFDAATNAFAQAKSFRELIGDRAGALTWLQAGEAYDWGDEIDPDEEMWADITRADNQVAEAFGRFMQSIALTQILCAMCLEAHVNLVADRHLSGKAFDAFDKLSIEGKWLLLPGIVGDKSMNPGGKPFQGFSELIRRRNNLVHPKGSELLLLLTKSSDPNVYLDSGMKDAAMALETTKGMIAELARILSEMKPEWLDKKGHKFYELTVSERETDRPV